MAGKYTFEIEQGDDIPVVLTLYDDTGKTTLTNLTGYSAKMQIKDTDYSTQLDEYSSVGGELVLGGALGTITFNVPAATTAAYDPGTYRYDLETTSPAGVVRKILKGMFVVAQEVTV